MNVFVCDEQRDTCLNCPLAECVRDYGSGEYQLDTGEMVKVRVIRIKKDRKKYLREYHYEYNKTDKRKEYHRKYYEKNRERIINRQMDYYYKNKEKAV